MFVKSAFHVKSLIYIEIFAVLTYQRVPYLASALSKIYSVLPAEKF